jgi:hypothetical protein
MGFPALPDGYPEAVHPCSQLPCIAVVPGIVILFFQGGDQMFDFLLMIHRVGKGQKTAAFILIPAFRGGIDGSVKIFHPASAKVGKAGI